MRNGRGCAAKATDRLIGILIHQSSHLVPTRSCGVWEANLTFKNWFFSHRRVEEVWEGPIANAASCVRPPVNDGSLVRGSGMVKVVGMPNAHTQLSSALFLNWDFGRGVIFLIRNPKT